LHIGVGMVELRGEGGRKRAGGQAGGRDKARA
jgi:hypothetical protein